MIVIKKFTLSTKNNNNSFTLSNADGKPTHKYNDFGQQRIVEVQVLSSYPLLSLFISLKYQLKIKIELNETVILLDGWSCFPTILLCMFQGLLRE